MENKLDQIATRINEVNFLHSHHDELSKAYLKEYFALEQAWHTEKAAQEIASTDEAAE